MLADAVVAAVDGTCTVGFDRTDQQKLIQVVDAVVTVCGSAHMKPDIGFGMEGCSLHCQRSLFLGHWGIEKDAVAVADSYVPLVSMRVDIFVAAVVA